MGRRACSDRFVRRRVIRAGAALVVAGIAGCAGDGPDEADASSSEPTTSAGNETAVSGGTATDRPETVDGETDDGETAVEGELDLREANVVEVEFEPSGDGYEFSVTLYHDDDGEDGYADWWQVEAIDGERLGRRDLLHAHDTAPFTRSETIDVPDDASCVVVRGHDQIHGYGGQAMIVNLDSGATNAVRQGSEPRSFEEEDCPR